MIVFFGLGCILYHFFLSFKVSHTRSYLDFNFTDNLDLKKARLDLNFEFADVLDRSFHLSDLPISISYLSVSDLSRPLIFYVKPQR